MDIFSVIFLAGGLAFFLYGMYILSGSLTKMAGGKLEATLKKMTSTKFKALTLGAGITVALQSSSTLTVILVGLVNSGIMDLNQTVGVIMGSNIGTTLTAWILSLSGIESTNFFIKMLKPENFAPIVALIGIFLMLSNKNERSRDIGEAFLGFAILMYGMKLMASSVGGLKDSEGFKAVLVKFTDPVLGVLAGAVFTGIIQSSAASVGILQAFALTGNVSYAVAIPIIMGQNIGTCVTALISSFGVSVNAKRVGIIHISFNIIGSLICLALFYLARSFGIAAFLSEPINAVGIAVVHSLFNVFTTAVLYPFSDSIVKISRFIIPDGKGRAKKRKTPPMIDNSLLVAPAFAVGECLAVTKKMGSIAASAAYETLFCVQNRDAAGFKQIEKYEQTLDSCEDELGTYLVKLAGRELSKPDSAAVSSMLVDIREFERIGDHCLNITEALTRLAQKKLTFSPKASEELEGFVQKVKAAADTYSRQSVLTKADSLILTRRIRSEAANLRAYHIERLKKGECGVDVGFIYVNIISEMAEIAAHFLSAAASSGLVKKEISAS